MQLNKVGLNDDYSNCVCQLVTYIQTTGATPKPQRIELYLERTSFTAISEEHYPITYEVNAIGKLINYCLEHDANMAFLKHQTNKLLSCFNRELI